MFRVANRNQKTIKGISMQNNYKRRPSIKKGFIQSVEVSDIIKNDFVGQNDYYIHTLSIKDDRGEVKEFAMRQISDEPKLPVDTYVSFRFNKNREFSLPLIEVKSFGKAFTQEELQAINNEIKTPHLK